jgi:hypothetical protein
MTNKLVVIINNLKVPKIKKILLYEMKFFVLNYSCLQNPWLGGYRPQIPVLSVHYPQLNLLNPPQTKFLGTPLHGRAPVQSHYCPCAKLGTCSIILSEYLNFTLPVLFLPLYLTDQLSSSGTVGQFEVIVPRDSLFPVFCIKKSAIVNPALAHYQKTCP